MTNAIKIIVTFPIRSGADIMTRVVGDQIETGLMERELKRIKNARLFLIPASEDTRGHLTTGFARFWKQQLDEFLQTVPRRSAL